MTLTGIGAATGALGVCGGPARVASVPVHFTSHQLCSATFVAGLDPQEFYNEAIKRKLGPIGALLRYEVDREQREVRTRLAGLVHSRAVHDGGARHASSRVRPAIANRWSCRHRRLPAPALSLR
jgi:hypothetical protein